MKIRRMMVLAAILSLATLGISSCKNEPKEKPQGEEPQKSEGITFRFSMPGQDAHVVDTRATIQDGPEWAIDQLWLYEFDKGGTKVVADPVNIRNTKEFTYTGTEAKFTYKNDDWKDRNEVRQFYFVANVNLNLQKGTTMAQFQEKLFEAKAATKSSDILYAADPSLYGAGNPITIPDDNSWRIAMTGQATQSGTPLIAVHSNTGVQVKLTRAVARIDIVNYMPKLTITNVVLFNAFEQSRALGGSSFVSPRATNAIASFAEIPASGVVGVRGNGAKIAKAFYLYEGKNEGVAGKDITRVHITAKYDGGVPKVYAIPFIKDPKGTKTFIDVKRNHLYKILVGDKDEPGTVTFKIVEEEWNTHDFNEVVKE